MNNISFSVKNPGTILTYWNDQISQSDATIKQLCILVQKKMGKLCKEGVADGELWEMTAAVYAACRQCAGAVPGKITIKLTHEDSPLFLRLYRRLSINRDECERGRPSAEQLISFIAQETLLLACADIKKRRYLQSALSRLVDYNSRYTLIAGDSKPLLEKYRAVFNSILVDPLDFHGRETLKKLVGQLTGYLERFLTEERSICWKPKEPGEVNELEKVELVLSHIDPIVQMAVKLRMEDLQQQAGRLLEVRAQGQFIRLFEKLDRLTRELLATEQRVDQELSEQQVSQENGDEELEACSSAALEEVLLFRKYSEESWSASMCELGSQLPGGEKELSDEQRAQLAQSLHFLERLFVSYERARDTLSGTALSDEMAELKEQCGKEIFLIKAYYNKLSSFFKEGERDEFEGLPQLFDLTQPGCVDDAIAIYRKLPRQAAMALASELQEQMDCLAKRKGVSIAQLLDCVSHVCEIGKRCVIPVSRFFVGREEGQLPPLVASIEAKLNRCNLDGQSKKEQYLEIILLEIRYIRQFSQFSLPRLDNRFSALAYQHNRLLKLQLEDKAAKRELFENALKADLELLSHHKVPRLQNQPHPLLAEIESLLVKYQGSLDLLIQEARKNGQQEKLRPSLLLVLDMIAQLSNAGVKMGDWVSRKVHIEKVVYSEASRSITLYMVGEINKKLFSFSQETSMDEVNLRQLFEEKFNISEIPKEIKRLDKEIIAAGTFSEEEIAQAKVCCQLLNALVGKYRTLSQEAFCTQEPSLQKRGVGYQEAMGRLYRYKELLESAMIGRLEGAPSSSS